MILWTDFLQKGLLKETMRPACLLLVSIVQGCTSQLFRRAKGSKVQGHCVQQKGASSQDIVRKLASAAQEALFSTHRHQRSPELQVGGWTLHTSGSFPIFPLLGLHRAALE